MNLAAPGEICVVGSCFFDTPVGRQTAAFAELLARYFPIAITPLELDKRAQPTIVLPSGREIAICRSAGPTKIVFYAGIPWTGLPNYDFPNFFSDCLRYAYCAWPSDELPMKLITFFNGACDVVLAPSLAAQANLSKNGIQTQIEVLPLAYPLETFLAKPLASSNRGDVVIGASVSFHPHDNSLLLLEAFRQEFSPDEGVSLSLHSTGDNEDGLDKIKHYLEQGLIYASLTTGKMSDDETSDYLDTIDVYASAAVSGGDNFMIHAALAQGKALAVTATDIPDLTGIYKIEPGGKMPARFPEIGNLVFGQMAIIEIGAIRRALRDAYNYAVNSNSRAAAFTRRAFAADFSFTRLADRYAEFVYPRLNAGKKGAALPQHFERVAPKIEERTGRFGNKLSFPIKKLIPLYDGGFFSLFNSFLTKMVWDLKRNGTLQVLPDWKIARIKTFTGDPNFFKDFCYGRPEDENIWLKLFEPLYGLSDEEMNDDKLLYANATVDPVDWNAAREPLLTHKYAYTMYKADWFQNWRRLYHDYYTRYISLRPAYQAEMDKFYRDNAGCFRIGVHVRHPTHAKEQPKGVISGTQTYIDYVRREIEQRGLGRKDWRVFVATDQERVIKQFKAEFGEHVVYFKDIRRTTLQQDRDYDRLSAKEQAADKYGVQHRAASDRSTWSTELAWEVIRDCMALANCHVMIHITSNISTAAAYMNPDLEMVYCEH